MRHTASSKLPAREHAAKVVAELVKLLPADRRQGACPSTCRDDTDREIKYHQEANFNYLTGAWDVAAASVLVTFDPASPRDIKHAIFVPPAVPEETMWSVAPPTLDEARARFDADTYASTADLAGALSAAQVDTLFTLPMTSEYPPLPPAVVALLSQSSPVHDSTSLLTALHVARLTKTAGEVERIRIANAISSAAHGVLMAEIGRSGARRVRTGTRSGHEGTREWEVEGEPDAEALFVAACRRNGATDQAYLPIVASGTRASTLHYVCNDRLFPSTARALGDATFTARRLARGCCGDVPDHAHATSPDAPHVEPFEPQVLLVDAGAEWQGYASDITRVIPVGNGGRFTDRAAEIYDLVLDMQKACEALVRPAAHWDTLHLRAHKVLIDGFIRLGIFRGEPAALLQSGLSAAFFPHGLGHSLGLDVHDSRQLLRAAHVDLPAESSATPAKLYSYLRIRRPLETGMVLTVEPGCYFAPQLMDAAGVWESELVDHDVLKSYLAVGGVRIEDVVVVTDDGCENLTTVVRDRDQVEAQCHAFCEA